MKVLTSVDVARAANCSAESVRRLSRRGVLEPAQIAGGHLLFSPDAVAIAKAKIRGRVGKTKGEQSPQK